MSRNEDFIPIFSYPVQEKFLNFQVLAMESMATLRVFIDEELQTGAASTTSFLREAWLLLRSFLIIISKNLIFEMAIPSQHTTKDALVLQPANIASFLQYKNHCFENKIN